MITLLGTNICTQLYLFGALCTLPSECHLIWKTDDFTWDSLSDTSKLKAVNDGEITFLAKPDAIKLIDESVQTNLKRAYEKASKHYNLRTRKVTYIPGQEIYHRSYQLSDFSKAFNAKLAPKYIKDPIESW